MILPNSTPGGSRVACVYETKAHNEHNALEEGKIMSVYSDV